jgi:transcriptional regulator with XRE-family HTH domain
MGRPPKLNLSPRFSELLHQIGSNVRYFREEQGLTQAALARRAKISNTTLNEIETRQFRDVRLSTLAALAQALETPVMHLLGGSDIELPSKDQAQLLKASESIMKITRKLK